MTVALAHSFGNRSSCTGMPPAAVVRARYVTPRLSVFVITVSGSTHRFSGGPPPGLQQVPPESPANGGLRLLPYRSDGACLADGRRLAALMADKHGIYGTGFSGGKVVARATDLSSVKEELLHATGLLLEALGGAMVTGCDLNTSPADMVRLARLTPHVLAAVGSGVEASTCTAHGTLGALDAVHPRAGTALVHGCGAVGGVVARELIARGWTVLSVDLDPRRASLPGARVLDPGSAWWREPVDVLIPCSTSGLIGSAIARELRTRMVVPAANAPFRGRRTLDLLRQRDVLVLPDPLVNAGAVIADSIERYAPEAWRSADPEVVYAFVADTIRRRSLAFLQRRSQGMDPAASLATLTSTPLEPPIGSSFPGWNRSRRASAARRHSARENGPAG